MIIVTKRATFNAAHRLYNPAFNDDKNKEIFGDCSNHFGHGHNYTIEVSIAGTPQKDTGFLVDLGTLGEVIQKEIVKKCDHKHLNHQVDFLSGVIPTVENLAEAFYKQLREEVEKISAGRLYRVRVWETEKNYAEYEAR